MDLKKQDLRRMTGISTSSIAKLTKGENVNTDILVKICTALNCNISDIMDVIPNGDINNQDELQVKREIN